jgi:hypothetical protein
VGTVRITTSEWHTAGEPFRIVTSGVPTPAGSTVAERRRFAIDHLDDIRALLCREPRGHADMYGCFVTPPDDEDGDLGVVFFHNDGYSTACGHGTIALVTWALESGVRRCPCCSDRTRRRRSSRGLAHITAPPAGDPPTPAAEEVLPRPAAEMKPLNHTSFVSVRPRPAYSISRHYA